MAYQVPSTNVFQNLSSNSGVVSQTPDLPVVIIGPAYNVVNYGTDSDKAFARTIVGSTVTGTNVSFDLPSPVVGQELEEDSVEVLATHIVGYVLNQKAFTGEPGSNLIQYNDADAPNFKTGSGAIVPGSDVTISYDDKTISTTVIEVVSENTLRVADIISPGTADAGNLTVSITVDYADVNLSSTRVIDSSSFTVDPQDQKVSIQASVFSDIVSADIHISYRALRQDLPDLIQLESADDIEGRLGAATPRNPAALACVVALAGAAIADGNIYFKAVESDDLAGYTEAFEELENHTVYSLVPLSQDIDVVTLAANHARAMSTPENRAWRVALVNTKVATTKRLGSASEEKLLNGALEVNDNGLGFSLMSENATFITDGVVPGDNIQIVQSDTPSNKGSFTVSEVRSNQEVVVIGSLSGDPSVGFYPYRRLNKAQQAEAIAGTSTSLGSRRVLHVQPDEVVIDSARLPGYFLCAAVGGMIAGHPVQQNLTNLTVPGIEDLRHSNFYFSKSQLNTAAGAGTFIVSQETQGGTPYVRHSLTTDMSTLDTQEILLTKNLDFLSYQYAQLLDRFIGKYNITLDTLNAVRQDIVATSEQLKAAVQPQIGPPLLDYEIVTIEQNPNSQDRITIRMNVSTVYPDNYNDLYLVV